MNQISDKGNTYQNQPSAAKNGGSAPRRSAGAYTLAAVLVVALICAAIGFIATKLLYQKDDKESNQTEQEFLALVDYADARIGLSDYHSDEMSGKNYYDERSQRCSAKWVKSGADAYPVPNAPITLEGGVTFIANRTRVRDFTDKGYVLSDGAPAAVEPGTHRYFSMKYNGHSVSACAKNHESYSLRLQNCVISALGLASGDHDVSFAFMGLNSSSTLNDLIATLGKPNGALGYSAVFIYDTGGENNRLELHYGYQGEIIVAVKFVYHPDTDTVDFESLDLRL